MKMSFQVGDKIMFHHSDKRRKPVEMEVIRVVSSAPRQMTKAQRKIERDYAKTRDRLNRWLKDRKRNKRRLVRV